MTRGAIIGIDPGLTISHASRIMPTEHATVYGLRADLTGTAHGAPADLAAWCAAQGAALVLVEVARGAVASERDGDPVLHNNIVAGELLGRLLAAGLPAAPVASGGLVTGWNWRTTLGVKGAKGPAARDVMVRQLVGARLTNPADVPAGPRGGILHHYWDGAGVALAGLDRLTALAHLSPLEACTHLTALESGQITALKARKKAGMLARKKSPTGRTLRAGGRHVRN